MKHDSYTKAHAVTLIGFNSISSSAKIFYLTLKTTFPKHAVISLDIYKWAECFDCSITSIKRWINELIKYKLVAISKKNKNVLVLLDELANEDENTIAEDKIKNLFALNSSKNHEDPSSFVTGDDGVYLGIRSKTF